MVLASNNNQETLITQVILHICHATCQYLLEHKTCDILAAERLRLMSFDSRLIIDSFQKPVCILKWLYCEKKKN